MSEGRKLTDEEFAEIVNLIAKPTFNYMMKRVNNNILNNAEYKTLDMNDFFNALISSLAVIDVNMIRWMQNFHKIKTNSDVGTYAFKTVLFKNIEEQLKIVLQ